MRGVSEAYELGMGEPIAIASEHGIGMPDLEDAIVEALEKTGWQGEPTPSEAGDEQMPEEEGDPDGPLQLAIVGRPNVGKSTLVNALVGDERVITGPQPGITRDAISIEWMEWSCRSS